MYSCRCHRPLTTHQCLFASSEIYMISAEYFGEGIRELNPPYKVVDPPKWDPKSAPGIDYNHRCGYDDPLRCTMEMVHTLNLPLLQFGKYSNVHDYMFLKFNSDFSIVNYPLLLLSCHWPFYEKAAAINNDRVLGKTCNRRCLWLPSRSCIAPDETASLLRIYH